MKYALLLLLLLWANACDSTGPTGPTDTVYAPSDTVYAPPDTVYAPSDTLHTPPPDTNHYAGAAYIWPTNGFVLAEAETALFIDGVLIGRVLRGQIGYTIPLSLQAGSHTISGGNGIPLTFQVTGPQWESIYQTGICCVGGL